MTREKAIEKLRKISTQKGYGAECIVAFLEALELIKFEEEKSNIHALFDSRVSCSPTRKDYGHIRLEEWSEGLALVIDGMIVWKSWAKYYKVGDRAFLDSSKEG